MPPVVAYTSPYVPAEWITAHGATPRRLMLPCRPALAVPQGACPFAALLAHHVANEGPPPDLLVVTTACDQMRRLPDLARGLFADRVFVLNMPATWQGSTARGLYVEEIGRLGRRLTALTGQHPTVRHLADVMARADQERERLENLRGYLSPRAWAEVLADVHEGAAVPDLPPGRRRRRPRRTAVGLVGGPLRREDLELYDLLEQAGAAVVLDATETGERGLRAPFDPRARDRDPLVELVRAYFDGIPDAFRRPDHCLHDWLAERIARRGVQALVLVRHMWCDPWHAQLSRLRQAGLPVVDVELDSAPLARERTRTRLETLVSMIR